MYDYYVYNDTNAHLFDKAVEIRNRNRNREKKESI